MADMTEMKNIIRIGRVQSVNENKMTARVKFEDKGGITSGDLNIIKRPVHDAQTAFEWIPNVNDMVLCIMIPDGGGDGFIIGEV